ncbi:hypothetical protein ACEPAG_360 [Sanghuangporus baumii]
MEPDSIARLRRIITTAEVVKEKTRHFFDRCPGPSVEVTNISDSQLLMLSVPSSSHLVRELVEAGAPRQIAEAISEKYHVYASRLAEYQANTTYMDTLRKLQWCPSLGHADFISAFQEAQRQIYTRALSTRKERILFSVKERFGQTAETAKELESKIFDQKFVPFLEKCFSKNRRPSREDKELLAKKTGMSYRQIHVWFQNRRSRTKKSSMRSDSQNEKLSCCSRASSVTLVEDNPLSDCITPSYAFPVMYPPEIEKDPFPCRFGDFSSFAKSCWPRSPNATELRSSDPDVSALISVFEKLQIDDDSESKTSKKKSSRSGASKSVTKFCYEKIRPTVIRPLHAPLTSLVRTEIVCFSRSSGTSSHGSDFAKQKESTSQNGEHSKTESRKPRQRKAVGQGRTRDDHQCLPTTEPANEQPVTPVAPSKTKRAKKKAVRSKPATRRGCKTLAEPEIAVDAVGEPEEPPSSHPSPTTSIESLPSLSYSTVSSSSSTYSVSPPSSFATLSDGGLMSSPFDEYRSNGLSLTLPPSLTFDDHPPPPATFTSDGFSFDLPKGPLDYPFDFGLPGYPSYSDSFDALAQELESSSDFMFPSSFELPCLAS